MLHFDKAPVSTNPEMVQRGKLEELHDFILLEKLLSMSKKKELKQKIWSPEVMSLPDNMKNHLLKKIQPDFVPFTKVAQHNFFLKKALFLSTIDSLYSCEMRFKPSG